MQRCIQREASLGKTAGVGDGGLKESRVLLIEDEREER